MQFSFFPIANPYYHEHLTAWALSDSVCGYSAEGSEVYRHQVLLLKKLKGATPAPGGFSNLRVSATQNH